MKHPEGLNLLSLTRQQPSRRIPKPMALVALVKVVSVARILYDLVPNRILVDLANLSLLGKTPARCAKVN